MALTQRDDEGIREPIDTASRELGFLVPEDRKDLKTRLVRRSSSHGIRPWIFAGDTVAVAVGPMIMSQNPISIGVLVLLYLALAGSASLYRSQLDPSVLDDSAALLGRLLIAGTVTYVLSPQGTSTVNQLGGSFGRSWWLALAISGLALLGSRSAVYTAVRESRRRGLVGHRTLILGAGRVAAELTDHLVAHPEYGLRPVALYDPFPAVITNHGLPVLKTGSLGEAISSTEAATVVIAFASVKESQMIEYLHDSNKMRAEFFYVPRLFEVASSAGRDLERVRAFPLQRLRRAAHRSPLWRLKGIFDRLFAALFILILSPLFTVLALCVLISTGRPIIFRQIRVGLDGREFGILKFRTLPNAQPSETDTAWAAEHTRQPRRLGSLMRKTSLDELPQLFNILKGEMSFVGPRPERPQFAGEFADAYPHYNYRHRVPTGLTGLAQINGLRGDTSISERTRFDNVYVETWSLWGDLKIILRTIRLMIPQRRAE